MDYAGAWTAERGHCFRFVYDEYDKPTVCAEPVSGSGWVGDNQRRWYHVDACTEHLSQLKPAPDRH